MAAVTTQLSCAPLGEARSPRVQRVDEVPNYELLGCVGSSRFGDVWLAREQLTDVIRAIKFLDKHDARLAEVDLEGVRHYQKCAHNHPHLLQILMVGQTDRCFYYVMEAADSEAPDTNGLSVPRTLRTMIERRVRLEPAEGLDLVRKLARGLALIHKQGLTHDDLKPENVLFVGGEPKIADLGLTRPLAARVGGGTHGYLAPEGADDVFALGKILYELISGRPLADFPRLDSRAVARPEAQLAGALQIMDSACQPNRARRFQTPNELADAIDEMLACSKRRWLSRRSWVIGAVVSFMLLTGGAWALSWIRRLPPQLAEITLHKNGQLYTGFRQLSPTRITPATPQRGASVSVVIDFEVRGAPTHDMLVALVLDTRVDSARLVYSGTPGLRGERCHAETTLIAPSGAGDYDVRVYVSHVKIENAPDETLVSFLNSLEKHSPPWRKIGTISVP